MDSIESEIFLFLSVFPAIKVPSSLHMFCSYEISLEESTACFPFRGFVSASCFTTKDWLLAQRRGSVTVADVQGVLSDQGSVETSTKRHFGPFFFLFRFVSDDFGSFLLRWFLLDVFNVFLLVSLFLCFLMPMKRRRSWWLHRDAHPG